MKFLSRLQVPGPTSLDDAANKRYVDSVGEGGGPHALTHIDDEGDRIPNVEPYIDEQNPGAPGLLSSKDKAKLNSIKSSSIPVVGETLVERDFDGDIKIRRLTEDLIDPEVMDDVIDEFIGDQSEQGDFWAWANVTDGVKDLIPLVVSTDPRHNLPVDISSFILFFLLVLYVANKASGGSVAVDNRAVRLWCNDSFAWDGSDYLPFDAAIYDSGNFWDSELPEVVRISRDGLYLLQGSVDAVTENDGFIFLVIEATDLYDAYELGVCLVNVKAGEEITLEISSIFPLPKDMYVAMYLGFDFEGLSNELGVISTPVSSPSFSIARIGGMPSVNLFAQQQVPAKSCNGKGVISRKIPEIPSLADFINDKMGK